MYLFHPKTIIMVAMIISQLLFIGNTLCQNTIRISGKAEEYKNKKVLVKVVKNYVFPDEKSIADTAVVDSLGVFSLNFRWNRPWPATLVLPGLSIQLFLIPGDSLAVRIKNGGIIFSGKNANHQNFLQKWNQVYDAENFKRRKQALYRQMNEDRFNAFTDSIREKRMKFFKEYFISSPPQKPFSDYILAEINYEWANDHYYFVWVKYQAEIKAGAINADSSFYDFLKKITLYHEHSGTHEIYYKFLNSYLNHRLQKYFMNILLWDSEMTEKKDFYLKKYRLAKELLAGKVRTAMLGRIVRDAIEGSAPDPIIREILNDYKLFNNELYERFKKIYEENLKIKKEQPDTPPVKI